MQIVSPNSPVDRQPGLFLGARYGRNVATDDEEGQREEDHVALDIFEKKKGGLESSIVNQGRSKREEPIHFLDTIYDGYSEIIPIQILR